MARVLSGKARGFLLLALAGAMVLGMQQPAGAACHIAAFDSASQSVQVNESAGRVTLTVELVGGQPTCEGTVDYKTFNGTAAGGQDYTAKQGTLRFTPTDDRKESVSIPIINDTADEASQSFTVRLSNGTGDLTADETPATVTIADNDPAPQPTASATKPAATRSPTASASASPSALVSPTPSPTNDVPSPSATPSATIQAAPAADTGSGSGMVFALVGVVALLAGAGYWFWRRRTTG